MEAVNDQVSQPLLRNKKLSHDDPYPREADVYLQCSEDRRDGRGEDNHRENLPLAPTQGLHDFYVVGIHFFEAGVDVDGGNDHRDRAAHGNHGEQSRPKADDKNRSQRNLWHAIGDDEVGLQNTGEERRPPNNGCDHGPEQSAEQKAYDRLPDRHADVGEKTAIRESRPELCHNFGWVAENERVDRIRPCEQLP